MKRPMQELFSTKLVTVTKQLDEATIARVVINKIKTPTFLRNFGPWKRKFANPRNGVAYKKMCISKINIKER